MGQLKLLVIDDEPAITALIGRIAEPCGFAVFATSDPAEFSSQYELTAPDVICLDLAMPDVDGVEISRYLADRGCRCPIIIVSGFDPCIVSSALRLAEARGLTVAGAIVKPINVPAFRQMLSKLAAACSRRWP